MITDKPVMKAITIAFAGLVLSAFLTGCASDNPVSSNTDAEATPLQIRVDVIPPSSYRTADTWNFWTTPVSVYFQLEAEAGTDGGDHVDDGHAHSLGTVIPVATLSKVTNDLDAQSNESPEYSGSIAVAGMQIQLDITDGADLYEMRHGGEIHEHHAGTNSHMMQVQVFDIATGHHAHGGFTVSNCELTLVAESDADTVEMHLKPVQSQHGYRYEVNGSLPDGTYDLHLEIEPPTFMRTVETKTRWIDHAEVEFSGFEFASDFSGGSVGEVLLTSNGDSLQVSMRAGSPKTYGAVGMGTLPASGDENVNFSVRLEDPTISSPGQILYDAGVNITSMQPESGESSSSTLKSVYGGYGFYFGENMEIGLSGLAGSTGDNNSDGDDGHAH